MTDDTVAGAPVGRVAYRRKAVRHPALRLSHHPESCGPENLPDFAARMRGRPLAIDLFCGAGGLSLGLERTGFQVILGVDNDRHSIETHRAYFAGCSLAADLASDEVCDDIATALHGIDVTLIAAGPPCQPFSVAGRGKMRSLPGNGHGSCDHRREYWRVVVDMAGRIAPRAVLIENVPGMAQGEEIRVVSSLMENLNRLGYDVYSRVLSSAQYGVPQTRERVFIVAIEPGLSFEWPRPAKRINTLRNCISDLPLVEAGMYKESCRYGGARTVFQRWLRTGVRSSEREFVFDHYARPVREDDLDAYRLMDHKTRYSDLPDELRRYRSDAFNDKYKRLHWDSVSRTITAHLARDGYGFIHPEQHRSLTIRESARIQTFPDWFRFSGFPGNAYSQIGNAVPPLLAAALGRSIYNALKKPNRLKLRPGISDITESLHIWMENQNPSDLAGPWRKAESFWKSILGTVLFEDNRIAGIRDFWGTYVRRWSSPSDYLGDEKRDSALRAIGKVGAADGLIRIAALLTEHQVPPSEILKSTFHGISKVHIFTAAALSGEYPGIFPAKQVIRSAARVLGEPPPRSKVDAHLMLARLAGFQKSPLVYSGLLEVSDRFCRENEILCASCPLNRMCSSSATSNASALPKSDTVAESVQVIKKSSYTREEIRAMARHHLLD